MGENLNMQKYYAKIRLENSKKLMRLPNAKKQVEYLAEQYQNALNRAKQLGLKTVTLRERIK